MKAREELPNDTVELKGLVYQLLDVVEEQKKLIANQNDRIETQFQKIEKQAEKIETQSQQIETQSQQITQQSEQITKQSQKIEEQSQKIDEQSQRIDQLTDQVNSLKRYRYGKKSEKVKKEKVEPDNQQETQEASPDANISNTPSVRAIGKYIKAFAQKYGVSKLGYEKDAENAIEFIKKNHVPY